MSTERHDEIETRVRAAIRQLLSGEVPEGLKCDIKSLCALAGVPRATLYRTYPYLKTEFDQHLGRLRANGEQPDDRSAQLQRLKAEIVTLRERLSNTNKTIADLEAFRETALSRLAAQHDEICALRTKSEAAQRNQLRILSRE